MNNNKLKVIHLPKGTKYIRNPDGTCTLIGDQKVEVTVNLHFKDIYENGKKVCRFDRFPAMLKDGSVFREVFLKEAEFPEDPPTPDEAA